MRPATTVIVAIAAAALTVACSASDEPAAPSTTTPAPAAAPRTTTATATGGTGATGATTATGSTDGQVVSVTVSGGKVTPPAAPVEVKLGSTVVIEVTADVADEIHVHGYDRSQQLRAGQPGRVEVQATIPGQFEVELENAGLLLLTLRVS